MTSTPLDAEVPEEDIARDASGKIIAVPGPDGLVEMAGGIPVKPGTTAKRGSGLPWWAWLLGAFGLAAVVSTLEDE